MSMQMIKRFTAAHEEKVTCIAIDPAHNLLFVAGHSTKIFVWSTKSNASQPVAVMKGHKGAITGLTYFTGMGLVISSSLDGTCIVWDDRFKVLQVLDARSPIRCLAWNQKQTVIGIGQNPSMQFYKMMDALQLVAYRRIRQREINIGGDCMPLPVDIKPDSSHRMGSKLLSKTLLEQSSNKADWDVLKKPLFRPITASLSGAKLGHTDAVVAIVITDTGWTMTGSLDRSLCIFDITRPAESVRKVHNAHEQGIVSIAHDSVNNWFVTGGFDGTVKVWSADGKQIECFNGVSDDIASAVYVPFTHSYWQVSRNGNVNAYDARAPARLTDYVHQSNGLIGYDVERLLVPPHSDCMFATTTDKGLIMYRYNHHGAYRTFQCHEGWIEAMISIQIPAIHDNSGKATSIRDDFAAVAQEYKATAPSLRQRWLKWMENRGDTEAGRASVAWPSTQRLKSISVPQSVKGVQACPNSEEDEAKPEESPLMQKRKTLMLQNAKEDVGERELFTKRRGTFRLTEYKSELPGSRLKAVLDQALLELRKEADQNQDSDCEDCDTEKEPDSWEEREGENNEYLFTACETGVVHQWALDKQIQCDRFEVVETHKVSKKHILALAYCKELHWILAAGAEGVIKVISLARPTAGEGTESLPTSLHGHTDKITALLVLKNYVAVSAGHDRQIRFWDLHTMTEIESGRKEEAHQAPICRLSYSEERNEMGSVALENVAKVWDVSRPTDSRLRFQLETPGEISQLHHIPWKTAWCTMSTDGVMRLWGDEKGDMVFQFNYNGGMVQSVLVDAEEKVVLAAMQDGVIRVLNLTNPIPQARYQGHTELITSVVPVHHPKGYASCSWDKSVNLWHPHVVDPSTARHHAKLLQCPQDFFNELHGPPKAISEFEKKNPKFIPASLNEPSVNQEVLDRSIAKNNILPPVPPIVLSSMAQKLNDQLNLLDSELLLETRTASELYR